MERSGSCEPEIRQMQRCAKKTTPGDEKKQRRPASRSTGRASTEPVENKTVLKS